MGLARPLINAQEIGFGLARGIGSHAHDDAKNATERGPEQEACYGRPARSGELESPRVSSSWKEVLVLMARSYPSTRGHLFQLRYHSSQPDRGKLIYIELDEALEISDAAPAAGGDQDSCGLFCVRSVGLRAHQRRLGATGNVLGPGLASEPRGPGGFARIGRPLSFCLMVTVGAACISAAFGLAPRQKLGPATGDRPSDRQPGRRYLEQFRGTQPSHLIGLPIGGGMIIYLARSKRPSRPI